MTLGTTRTGRLALLAAVACMITLATSVAAYGPQVPTLITVTPSALTFLCGHPEVVEATVLDQDGLPIKQATVAWSFSSSPSSRDRILQGTSKTNKLGVARTMVKLACVAGDRSITASTGGISGSAVVHVDLGHPGQGANNSAQFGAGVRLGALLAVGAALGNVPSSMRAARFVVDAAAETPLGSELGPRSFLLLFIGLAALIVVRRVVLPRR